MGASLCLKCGYRWNSPDKRPPRCPNCKTEEWDKESEGEACGLDGGICDQCGCRFTTELGKAKVCPNCGSDKWDSGKVAITPEPEVAITPKSREFECTKCGHRWTSHLVHAPKRCPVRKCETRKIKEVLK